MPIVRIEMLAGRSQAAKDRIASEVTDVLSRNLGSPPEHIFVVFSSVSRSDWAIGGRFSEDPPAFSTTSPAEVRP